MSTTSNASVSIYNPGTSEKKEYAIDTSFEPYRREAFRHKTIPAQRQSIQMTNITGEGTVNTEGLWRREQVEWTMGAGQFSLDRKGDNQETRFLNSKGVDVFSYPFQATLLPDTQQLYGSTASTLLMSRCGDNVVVVEGSTVKYFVSGSWGTSYSLSLSGSPTIYDIATNDTIVFLATSSGIWYAQPSGTGAGSFSLFAANDSGVYSGGYTMVAWSNDQLIASSKNRLYAFQPRSTTDYPVFGSPPSTSKVSVDIDLILGDYDGFTPTVGYSTITTKADHNLSVGQPITISNSNADTFYEQLNYNSGSVTLTTFSGSYNPFRANDVVNITYTDFVNNATYIDSNIVITAATDTTISYVSQNLTQSIVNANAGTGYYTLLEMEVIGINASPWNGDFVVNDITNSTTFSIISTPSLGMDTESIGGNVISNLFPDTLVTHENDNWVWSGATGGDTQVYFAGYVSSPLGNKGSGAIYRSNMLGSSTSSATSVQTITATSASVPWNLDYPVQALPMSPDEYPTCIQSYLNYIFIGTNRGIRMTQTLSIYDPTATATGDLKSGPLIPNILQPVTLPVTSIIGDGRYVWFTWNNYDTTSTGLGKLDLSTFINGDPLTPAYASDLMVTGQGIISCIDWDPVTCTPIMAVSGQGIYGPYATNEGGIPIVTKYVASGQITSGIFDYGIPDPKIPVYFDFNGVATNGSNLTALVITEPNDPTLIQSFTVPSTGSFTSGAVNEYTVTSTTIQARQFKTTVTLNAGTKTITNDISPILNRWTLKSWPAVVQGTEISVVIQMFSVNVVDGLEVFTDPYAELFWLETRRQNQDIVTYTEGPLQVTAVVDGIDWIPHKRRDNWENGYEGDLVLNLKTIGQYTYSPSNLSSL